MIYRLRRKFILISTISVLSVISLVFVIILSLNVSYLNRALDIIADTVSEGGGRFPSLGDGGHKPDNDALPPQKNQGFGFITPETPFSTRHFTVLFDKNGNVIKTNTDAIYSITEDIAIEYANKVISNNASRGWLKNYRYKAFSSIQGSGVVFIDGSMVRASLVQSMTIVGLVLLCCAALVLLLIILLSKRIVKPIAESYEKQKQFITDANHELKTPLTLILANLDIAENELGKNEWLDDIRIEAHRMTELVNQLVALSRMDEESQPLFTSELCLSDLIEDAASEFIPLAKQTEKNITLDVTPNIQYVGDEALLRRLLSVLLDNAVKYCDKNGDINIKLIKHRRVILTIENTYADTAHIEINRLFDRFYRADKARTYSGSYGVGLSIAKAIVQKHKGDIIAYKKDDSHIGFKVVL